MRLNWIRNRLQTNNSQTTMELRHFIEGGACLFGAYPIWDENHRKELEQKILDHYWFRQIGFETFARFKHQLNTRLREIMPYYVDLYKTTLFEYNPIHNYDMVERFEDDSKGSEKVATTSKGENINKSSDTPQSSVDNIDNGYLSNLTKDNTTAEGNTDTENTHNAVHTGERVGNIGVTTTQQLITQEREIILNIDMMIIDELQDLFLGVY